MAYYGERCCGLWYVFINQYGSPQRRYLPQVEIETSTTILATTSRTLLRQTFVNTGKQLDEAQYSFPLYDGVSVVDFKCVTSTKTLIGVVKEKEEARADFEKAKARGETAGLLEQLPEASDVFTTKIGNLPAGEKVLVEITYLGELKHDAETDGSRFTIPTYIAPRYSPNSESEPTSLIANNVGNSIKIVVDVALEEGTAIRGLQSPSHPIAVTMGRTSTMQEDDFESNHASATLTLGSATLEKDFVIVVLAKGQDTPKALLETHSTISNQRALMTTLVPKFNIPNISPEIVFVVDRSGSMSGKIPLLVAAMKVFLKSLPIGIKFNICSFGSNHSFLFKKSKTYDQNSLKEALKHLDTFDANYGGTEMLKPIKKTVENRYKDLPLEVMLLTDGEIWNQQELFDFINEQKNARFFTLGIGDGASTALVEGIARAGDGFAQFVNDGEKMDKRVVRMLKGALTPHIQDYTLEVNYNAEEDKMSDDEFEIIESFKKSMNVVVTETELSTRPTVKKTISLFNPSGKEEPTNPPAGRYDNLPKLTPPKVLQAPHKVPSLFPFNRTTVYLLLGPDSCQRSIKSVTLRGTSDHGPLELEIPVQDVGAGTTIHQLAAKKAVHELEQGRGWITQAMENGKPLKTIRESQWDLLVEREAVRLGVQFQVGGKWCSFVALEKNSKGAEGEQNQPSSADLNLEAEGNIASFGKSPPLFGSSLVTGTTRAQLPASGGLFGSTNSISSGSLFGNAAKNATTSASLFGHDSFTSGSLQAKGSGFGSNMSTMAASSQASSCFPSSNHLSQPKQQGFSTGGLFGTGSRPFVTSDPQNTLSPATTGNSLFGQIQSPSPGSSLFGITSSGVSSTNNPFTSTNTTSANNPFGSSNTSPAIAAALRPSLPLVTASDLSKYASEMQEAASMPLPDEDDPDLMSDTNADQTSSIDSQRRSSPRSSSAASFGFGAPAPPPAPMVSRPAPMMRSMVPGGLPNAPTASLAMVGGSRSMPRGQVDMSSSVQAFQPVKKARKRSAGPFASFLSRGGRVEAKKESKSASPDLFSAEKEEACSEEEQAQDFDTEFTQAEDDKLDKVIEMQEFDGSWNATEALWKLIGIASAQVAALKGTDKAKATALAIAWLEIKMAKEEATWEMVVDKAKSWLNSGGNKADELISQAKNLF